MEWYLWNMERQWGKRSMAGLLVLLFVAVLLPKDVFHECVDHGTHAFQGSADAEVKAACSVCDIAMPTHHPLGMVCVPAMTEGPSTDLVSPTAFWSGTFVASSRDRGPPEQA